MDSGDGNPNSEALQWLLEMELVNNPRVLNSIILNVFRIVKGVKDADFIIDTQNKKLLIYLELTWFYRKFRQTEVGERVGTMIEQALPTFQTRVVFDRTILNKALDIMKKRTNGPVPSKDAAPATQGN